MLRDCWRDSRETRRENSSPEDIATGADVVTSTHTDRAVRWRASPGARSGGHGGGEFPRPRAAAAAGRRLPKTKTALAVPLGAGCPGRQLDGYGYRVHGSVRRRRPQRLTRLRLLPNGDPGREETPLPGTGGPRTTES